VRLGDGDVAIEVDDRRYFAAGQRLRDPGGATRGRGRLRVAQRRRGEFTLSERAIGAAATAARAPLLLEAGTLLRAPEIAVAASAGMARVRGQQPTRRDDHLDGDELIEPGDPIADYQVRRSNAYRRRRHVAHPRLRPRRRRSRTR